MSIQWRKITGDDYIPDMIETINNNTEALIEAINDINEFVNDGDGGFNTLTVNENGEATDVSYSGTGKIENNGDIEAVGHTLKGEELEVSGTSTFSGTAVFNSPVDINDNLNIEADEVELDAFFNIRKSITQPIRTFNIINDIGQVGAVSNNYNINVADDMHLIFNGAGTDFNLTFPFNLTNARNNQIIYFTVRSLPVGAQARVRLNDDQLMLLNERDSVKLSWRDLPGDTGEWIILHFCNGTEVESRIQ